MNLIFAIYNELDDILNIKVYYSNSTNDVSWQFPLSQKESNTFNSLYHPRCAQGYLEFLPPNPSQCANANDIYLHVQKLHDVQICEQKFSNYLRIHYYSTKAIIVLVFEKYTGFQPQLCMRWKCKFTSCCYRVLSCRKLEKIFTKLNLINAFTYSHQHVSMTI